MYTYHKYPFVLPPEISVGINTMYQVVVVGARLTGLTLALALAKLGVKVVVLDENNRVSEGSRAICFSKRSLEIFDKLGVAKPMMDKGVKWDTGRIFYKEKEVDSFNLSPEKHSKYPAFINLQQYYAEQFLIEAAQQQPNIEIRWLNKVYGLQTKGPGAQLAVSTPGGDYTMRANYAVACDGSKSTIRGLLNLTMPGDSYDERFLITDFLMEADFPSERWFWFDPPFAPGQSILLHKQPDNLWRLDFKLGKAADNALAKDDAFISSKIQSVVGSRPFKVVWASIYSFSNKMLDTFIHGNIIFAGDAAHVMSPFGARGANSGIDDAYNLAWKLAAVLKGKTAERLLETYNQQRVLAAQQNIVYTTHSATFIAPPTVEGLSIRNSILKKAVDDTSAKKQINCGRLSTPAVYDKYPGSENGTWQTGGLQPGMAVKDCILNNGDAYLCEQLGYSFTVMCVAGKLTSNQQQNLFDGGTQIIEINTNDSRELVALYELTPSAAYLITPDQYILGRWKDFTVEAAFELINKYLSGEAFSHDDIKQIEPQVVDKAVFDMIINA